MFIPSAAAGCSLAQVQILPKNVRILSRFVQAACRSCLQNVARQGSWSIMKKIAGGTCLPIEAETTMHLESEWELEKEIEMKSQRRWAD